VIPLSTQKIRVRVSKGESLIQELSLSRPSENGGSLVAQATLRLEAANDLTVRVEAVQEGSDLALATGTKNGVRIVPNQRTGLKVELQPVFAPTLTAVTPTNGGPGVSVTLTGNFGNSGYYGIRIGEAQAAGSLSAGNLLAQVPNGARSGAVIALADGVLSEPGPAFQVLSVLTPSPLSANADIGGTLQFSASAQDTEGTPVASPTLTRWEVVTPSDNPRRVSVSPVGVIDENGLFTAQATGTAWIRVWSGNLPATASISVQ
jgi:hypothetical protein